MPVSRRSVEHDFPAKGGWSDSDRKKAKVLYDKIHPLEDELVIALEINDTKNIRALRAELDALWDQVSDI